MGNSDDDRDHNVFNNVVGHNDDDDVNDDNNNVIYKNEVGQVFCAEK